VTSFSVADVISESTTPAFLQYATASQWWLPYLQSVPVLIAQLYIVSL
jgi:hypothetical protein